MNLVLKRECDVLIVCVKGEIDHHNAGKIRDSVDMELKSGIIKTLIFDFSKLDFMDSSGIGVIMGRYKLISSFGGKVYVTGATKYINKVIRLSGLGNIVGLCKTNQECVMEGGR